MSIYWSELVSRLSPYVPGEQPKQQGLIKLNTNENPYPPSATIAKAITSEVVNSLRFYPDPESLALRKVVAKTCDVSAENVFIGNGSDEVLALAFMSFFKQDKPILFPDITYSFYPTYCQLYEIDYTAMPLTAQFTVNVQDYTLPNGGIIIANPNAPTGIAVSLDVIETILKANPNTVVIIDEAYVDFGAKSACSLVSRYRNLLVVQTLSKSRSLAGLRVGFAVGHPQLINGLERVKNSFNSYPIDRMAEIAAIKALEDVDYFEQCRKQVIATRERTSLALQRFGFDVLPSHANFLFAQHLSVDAKTLFTKLRENNILVRHFNKPRIDQFLRISIGTDDEMQELITCIEHILS